MIYRAKDMVEDVKVAIDENRNNEALLAEADIDTLSLDDIIYSKLATAARLVEMEAPLIMLESGHNFVEDNSKDFFIGEDGKGFIVLPNDFMRLICFRMSDWERTVYEAITENHPSYKLQSSKWKGVCGTKEKPVVAIVRRSEGKVLEFYSSEDNKAKVEQAAYLPYPHIDESGGIDISQDCYVSSVFRAASLALGSLGDQLSGTMLEISKGLLGV